MRSLTEMRDEEVEKEKKRQRQVDVLEKKIARAKGMLKCASSYLLKSGTFGTCGGCDNSGLCYEIRRLIAEDISIAYKMVK